MALKLLSAAVLLLATAVSTRASDCYAIETDMKYMIPQGVFGTFGGCVKGTKSSDGSSCTPSTKLDGTIVQGVYGYLSSCCDEVEKRTRVDPRNGKPMPEQANAKAVCNTYKKPQAPAAAPSTPSTDCFAIETDMKYMIPQGVFGTFGGCVKGTKSSDGSSCTPSTKLDGTIVQGVYGSLSSCCEEVEKRTRIDPRNGKPMPEQANAKAVCNTYKKQQTPGSAPATAPAQQQQQGKEKKAGDGSSRKYFIFKGFDLLPSYYVDVWSNGASYNRVCGGKEAVARACNSNENCNAFTFGAESDCGYLKRKYHSDPAEPLLFKNEGRGWDVYVSELIIPETRGGSLDCVALKKPAHPLLEEVCSIKQALPQSAGSLYA